MSESFEKAGQDAAALQKMWLANLAKTFQAAFQVADDSAPKEIVRQVRAGLLKGLAQSWDDFMRSPQFLDGMRQWMSNAVAFRKISNEYLGRMRGELQAPSQSDLEAVMLSLRHLEKRLLDRMDEMSLQLAERNGAPAKANQGPRRRAGDVEPRKTRRKPRLVKQ